MIRGSTSVAGDCGMKLEALGARQNALDVCNQYGTPIEIMLRGESNVDRDRLSSIKQRDRSPSFPVRAFPVERQPDRRKLEKAGIREEVDVLIYTPIQAWIDAGHLSDATLGDDFAAIDTTKSTIILDGTEFNIADKGLSTRVGEYPVYITFGLKRT